MNHGFILGYHGCTKETATEILSKEGAHLEQSKSEYEWLGEGVYFWENSYDRALKWAIDRYSDRADVVGAVIVFENSALLLFRRNTRSVLAFKS